MPAGGESLRRATLGDVRSLLSALGCVCRLLNREPRPPARRALRVAMMRTVRRALAALDRL